MLFVQGDRVVSVGGSLFVLNTRRRFYFYSFANDVLRNLSDFVVCGQKCVSVENLSSLLENKSGHVCTA